MAIRGRVDFVGHNILSSDKIEATDPQPVNNIIYKAKSDDEKWVEDATSIIGDWRAIFRSTYIRWALSINGLYVATEKYSNPEWIENHAFEVKSFRLRNGQEELVPIASWTGSKASEAHSKTIAMLAAFGLIDMYGCLEEFIFALYRTYLNHNPGPLLQGNEYRALKKLYRDQKLDSNLVDDWHREWKARLDSWQKRKIYDGLKRVFLAFCNETRLKEPSWFTHTTVETWAETIEGIGLLRNALLHGVKETPIELADFCSTKHSLNFDFKTGESIIVRLDYLQALELFCHKLVTAINASLMELVLGADPEIRQIFE